MYPTFDTVQYQYKGKAVHPAKKLYTLLIAATGVGILLSFIAMFVPWVQKYVGGGTDRYFVYPFKICIQDMRRTDNYFTCFDNNLDITGVIFGGNTTCQSLFISVIVLVFLTVIPSVVNLVLQIVTFLRLPNRPLCLHYLVTFITTIFGVGCSIAAWAVFIVYAEKDCNSAQPALFPVGSYSYGFILMVFSSAFFIVAMILACMIIGKIKKTLPTYNAKAPASFEGAPVYAPSVATTPYMMY